VGFGGEAAEAAATAAAGAAGLPYRLPPCRRYLSRAALYAAILSSVWQNRRSKCREADGYAGARSTCQRRCSS
jgi:hypothetical protein